MSLKRVNESAHPCRTPESVSKDSESTPLALAFETRSGVRHGCALSSTLFNYVIDCILSQGFQGCPWARVVHVFDLADADDPVLLSNTYWEMQSLLESVKCHAAAVGMRINASKMKTISEHIPFEQRQAVRFYGEP